MIEGLRGISRKYLPICEFDAQRLKQQRGNKRETSAALAERRFWRTDTYVLDSVPL
jgi:hypothetical protein